MRRFALLLLFLFSVSLSEAATYYVRSSGGSDGNAGTSFGAGWATIQYAADNASSAGDVVLV